MMRLAITIFLSLLCAVRVATAQQTPSDPVWVQIEAHPTLREAQERARGYADRLADVNGFALAGGWYGIVLGPYSRDDAQRVLRIYRADRQVPQDSFVAFSRSLGQQFWPVGENGLSQGLVTAPQAILTAPTTTTPTTTGTGLATMIKLADETPAQARRSEQLLTGAERRDLQIALQAAGFYNAAIDGAFGAGTRRSMADWQAVNGFEATGILTSQQRQALMDDYNAPLISVGMARIDDTQAGISMEIPAGAVSFARYEPPFAHYDASDDLGARVLLISQPGSQATLSGLYDIMQTLEIVPLNGPRERGRSAFTLEGRSADLVSYTQADLKDGEIKGFTLVWPAGDGARRARVLAAMKASFGRTDGVLDPAAGADAGRRIDLVSGLQVRKPILSRSGFYSDTGGTVVTTSDVVQGCTRITLDGALEAQLVTDDAGLGVAVLQPKQSLAPMASAQFSATPSRLDADVAVSGFSYEGILGAPTLTFGTVADTRGLGGEPTLKRLALAALPGDAGGPVLDTGGSVLGMLLSPQREGRQLPGDVSLAANADAIRALLDGVGLRSAQQSDTAPQGEITPVELTRIATGMTVLVSCWD